MRYVVDAAKKIGLVEWERVSDLGLRPHVIAAFLALGIGVIACREGPRGDSHVAENKGNCFFDSYPKQLLATVAPDPACERDELGIVVEHLFEVRHEPEVIGRVAGNAAA